MRAQYRRGLRSTASAVVTWVTLKLEDIGLLLFRFASTKRGRHYEVRPVSQKPAPSTPAVPKHADERTARRIAEGQLGGMSSQEGTERYLRGENPGGLHHKAVRRDEGPKHERPGQEEPEARVARTRRGSRHLSDVRRGA